MALISHFCTAVDIDWAYFVSLLRFLLRGCNSIERAGAIIKNISWGVVAKIFDGLF
jgi:hypothetical protein